MNKELWEKAVAFHGHECPGLAIGVKACEAAMLKMNIGCSDDEEIVCITENDACGVDAIQVLLGCSVGKGNLLYHLTGKQAFTFFNRKNGQKLRIYLKAEKPENEDRQAWQEALLNSAVEDLFRFSEPKIALPETARIFTSITCEVCGEKASENKIRLQDGKKVCMDCFQNYERGF